MNTTLPAEILALKARIDQWRAMRSHIRERMPTELRAAIVKLARQFPPALIRRVLKVDPWRLHGSMTSQPAPARKKQTPAFFALPIEVSAPAPISTAIDSPGFRLQLERPDGSRLTLILPAFDFVSARQFCADFLRGGKP